MEPFGSAQCRCKQTPVLVAEDNQFNQNAMMLMLQSQLGLTPDIADDGLIALQKFKDKMNPEAIRKVRGQCSLADCQSVGYQAILMDINMPNMNGIDATKHILEYQEQHWRPEWGVPKAKVVAVTAYQNPQQLQECRNVGMVDIIQKGSDVASNILQVLKEQVSPILKQYKPRPKPKMEKRQSFCANQEVVQ
mmetsp:Transcript_16393/g.27764  ORF Transcript_16393/g.27764 Transcript_16393/m.27764 type:complete len:192 (-) Transcript_16393:9-584(-)